MSTKDDLLNGAAAATAIDAAKQAFVADPMLVALADRILSDVKAGRVTSVAAILVGPAGNVQWPAHGVQATELYLGAGLFQRTVEGMVTQQKSSRILRPGG